MNHTDVMRCPPLGSTGAGFCLLRSRLFPPGAPIAPLHVQINRDAVGWDSDYTEAIAANDPVLPSYDDTFRKQSCQRPRVVAAIIIRRNLLPDAALGTSQSGNRVWCGHYFPFFFFLGRPGGLTVFFSFITSTSANIRNGPTILRTRILPFSIKALTR